LTRREQLGAALLGTDRNVASPISAMTIENQLPERSTLSTRWVASEEELRAGLADLRDLPNVPTARLG